MKKPIPLLLLLCCLVLAMGAPVSADFYIEVCNADDFTNALVDYCNHHEVRNTTGYDLDLCNYDCQIFNVSRTKDTLDFKFEVLGSVFSWGFLPTYWPIPFAEYLFYGAMHVDKLHDGLHKPYTLDMPDGEHFTASGAGWDLQVTAKRRVTFI